MLASPLMAPRVLICQESDLPRIRFATGQGATGKGPQAIATDQQKKGPQVGALVPMRLKDQTRAEIA
jgi:hypothetical protein